MGGGEGGRDPTIHLAGASALLSRYFHHVVRLYGLRTISSSYAKSSPERSGPKCARGSAALDMVGERTPPTLCARTEQAEEDRQTHTWVWFYALALCRVLRT